MKKWNVKLDGRRMSANEIINHIFYDRGIDDVYEFLHPNKSHLIPFNKMKNIDLAADKLLKCLNNNGSILVYYDSDTDGCTSGSIMTRYLRHYTDKVDTYINRGKLHGMVDFDFTYLKDYDLLIIVDAIEDSASNYYSVFEQNCDLIVLDHHQIPDDILEIQDKICLVSSANDYPNPNLSGAGVVYKFCSYIDSETLNDYAQQYLDLSATGIMADMCSVGLDAMENRYICYEGFNNINNIGIKKINGSYDMNSTAVSFGIAPLINAGNRTCNNNVSMDLFTEDDENEVKKLIKQLKLSKTEQTDLVDELFKDMEEQVKPQINCKCLYFFIDPDSDSVAGLLANKAMGKYHRPIMVLRKSTKGGQYSGSMRAVGIENFNDIINRTGVAKCFGHASAAGVKIPVATFDEFRDKIEYVLKDYDFTTETDVDVKLQQKQITFDLVKQLKDINKISGNGFTPIKVMIDNITDYKIKDMSDGKHLKIETPYISFIMWNFNDWESLKDKEDMVFSAIGTLDMNYFGKKMTLQLIMEDYKFEDCEI